MIKHSILIVLSVGVLSLGVFRPYMPGDYDSFAAGLSTITQLVMFASLLLVPIGIGWWLVDRIRSRQDKRPSFRTPFHIAVWVASVIIMIAAAIGALGTDNTSIAVIILVLGGLAMIRYSLAIRRLKQRPDKALSTMPYYLIVIPLATLFIRLAYLHEVKARSTESAIRQTGRFIAEIETYKKVNGLFPISLESTIDDYRPSVAGIRGLRYEMNGKGYNVYFEQFSDRFGTQEIVMYNALDEHEMTVHNQDLLREAPGQIIRGYYEVRVLTDPHWKIFLFD